MNIRFDDDSMNGKKIGIKLSEYMFINKVN